MEEIKLIVRSEAMRKRALQVIERRPLGPGFLVAIKETTRTLEQNDKLHAVIQDIAKQATLAGQQLSVDEWKIVFSATLFGQKVVPALEGGGFIIMTKRTSKMSRDEVAELIDFIHAWGAERGMEFTV